MENLATKNKIKNIWESDLYLQHAKRGSLDRRHFGMKVLKKYSSNAQKILDLGCGEGTRLAYLAKDKEGVGIDISNKAIKLAKKSYSKMRFVRGDLEALPFDKEEFDLVYSAFVLEHLENPEKVIDEAIRVAKKGGVIGFIAPNYGAPNRASPVFGGSRMKKFMGGFLKDMTFLYGRGSLDWLKVKAVNSSKHYFQDSDTLTEPYVTSLVIFLKGKGLKILGADTCWEEELPKKTIYQKFFKFLAKAKMYPFLMWGPHLVVIAQKVI